MQLEAEIASLQRQVDASSVAWYENFCVASAKDYVDSYVDYKLRYDRYESVKIHIYFVCKDIFILFRSQLEKEKHKNISQLPFRSMSLVTVLQERLKALDHLEANAHQLASPKADTLKACLKRKSFKNEGVGVGPFGMKQFMWKNC